jgi:hypothetical protein
MSLTDGILSVQTYGGGMIINKLMEHESLGEWLMITKEDVNDYVEFFCKICSRLFKFYKVAVAIISTCQHLKAIYIACQLIQILIL